MPETATHVGSGKVRELYELDDDKSVYVSLPEADFRALVEADPEITAVLDAHALAEAFDLSSYTRHADAVFERLRTLAQKEEPVHA